MKKVPDSSPQKYPAEKWLQNLKVLCNYIYNIYIIIIEKFKIPTKTIKV